MYSRTRLLSKYIHYRFSSYNSKGHGMHSPFVYEMIREVFLDKKKYPAYIQPELYKKKLLQDDTVLEIRDFGAGSASGKTKNRKVSDIAKTSVKHKRYSRLIYRIASYYNCKNILEMGTSLGVTSSYLAQVPELEQLVTMEGADAVADVAEKELRKYEKVKVVRGEFEGEAAGGRRDVAGVPTEAQSARVGSSEQGAVSRAREEQQGEISKTNLDHALSILPRVDLAFIDGNHRLIPTLKYFETILPKTHGDSIIIFDDIHWSEEMEIAWERIRADERVKLSIDLFFIGIVFFRNEFREKQHFTISF